VTFTWFQPRTSPARNHGNRDAASEVLPPRASDNGMIAAKQIVFAGERFDVMQVRRWRELLLGNVNPFAGKSGAGYHRSRPVNRARILKGIAWDQQRRRAA
jgi:hypothetical protein